MAIFIPKIFCLICNREITDSDGVKYTVPKTGKMGYRHTKCKPKIKKPKVRKKNNRDMRTQVIPNKKRKTRAKTKDNIAKGKEG